MTDSQAPNPNTVRAATPGAFRRFLELLFMLFSAVLVVFSWDSAIKVRIITIVNLRERFRVCQREPFFDLPLHPPPPLRLIYDHFWAEPCLGQTRGRAPWLGQVRGRALRPHDQLYLCFTYDSHV